LAMGIAKWHAHWGMDHLGKHPLATAVPDSPSGWGR
jgi:hypothetical protein